MMRRTRLSRYYAMNPLLAMSVVAASAALIPPASADTTVAPAAANDTTPRLFSTPSADDDDEPRTRGEGMLESQCLSGSGAAVYGKVPGMESPCIVKAPPRTLFCDPSVNACDPAAADPCPSWNDSCRWSGSVDWMGPQSTGNSSAEKLSYSLGSKEPELKSKYGHGPCIDHPSVYSNAIIVDDLGEHENTYGCGDFEAADDGRFTLRSGDSITTLRDDGTFRATPCIAPIELHQLGAGYDPHVYFTHSYGYTEPFHKITGRWQVNQGTRSAGKDTWFEMGTFSFRKGGRIEANNMREDATGDDNVVFDAIAFVPFNYSEPGPCNLNDGGL
ncbi:hypothetical protein [Streptomyces sp. NPDC091212]|uniref:hypothetical protein n=1 Tax=Streptomyces sp. NPDC091212 TaxID=3155191 RepID=UPI0034181D9E